MSVEITDDEVGLVLDHIKGHNPKKAKDALDDLVDILGDQGPDNEKIHDYLDGADLAGGYLPGETERVIKRMREEKWKDVKPDHMAFALSYLDSMSHVKAARDIGRPGKGLSYIRNPYVLAFIRDLQEDRFANDMVTEGWLRQKYLELLPKLMGEEESEHITSTGLQFSAKRFFPSETRAVLSELGKTIGVGKDVGATVNIFTQPADALTDDQLMKIAQSGTSEEGE